MSSGSQDTQQSEHSCDNAVSAFVRETSVILAMDSATYSFHGMLRQESIKMFILKVLLYIGMPTTGNGMAVIARLIEVMFLHPELSPEQVIEDFADTHNATVDAVDYVIEKNFNVYDSYFCDRVEQLTKSHPMTAKDVLCDLSVYIKIKYLSITER